MGGIGSGRHFHYSTRSYTDDYLDLDIRTLNQRGWLDKTTYQNLSWKRNGQEIGSIQFLAWTRVQFPDEKSSLRLKYKSRTNGGDWQELNYKVDLETTKCNFGGLRYWFRCPECNKRACVLYGGTIFKCRSCHGLVHKSRNESALDQAIRRLHKEKDKLYTNDDISLYDSVKWLFKPKWMRHKVFNTKKAKMLVMEAKVNALIFRRFGSYINF
tara:strand:- start:5013 stop:5651 length:639 start_codon:yes stop_codon:yes gene_type:complete